MRKKTLFIASFFICMVTVYGTSIKSEYFYIRNNTDDDIFILLKFNKNYLKKYSETSSIQYIEDIIVTVT